LWILQSSESHLVLSLLDRLCSIRTAAVPQLIASVAEEMEFQEFGPQLREAVVKERMSLAAGLQMISLELFLHTTAPAVEEALSPEEALA
jgi:hypothetical protein